MFPVLYYYLSKVSLDAGFPLTNPKFFLKEISNKVSLYFWVFLETLINTSFIVSKYYFVILILNAQNPSSSFNFDFSIFNSSKSVIKGSFTMKNNFILIR